MKEQPIGVLIFGVIVGIVVIAALLKYVNEATKELQPREYMFRVVMICFVLVVGIFAVDKIVALRFNLLTDNESGIVFDTIKEFLLIVTSFYFGTQVKDNKL